MQRFKRRAVAGPQAQGGRGGAEPPAAHRLLLRWEVATAGTQAAAGGHIKQPHQQLAVAGDHQRASHEPAAHVKPLAGRHAPAHRGGRRQGAQRQWPGCTARPQLAHTAAAP